MKADSHRDRSVEQLLRRTLRADAGPPALDACLDAELLAAWVDGGLDARGLAMAEAHVSSCARCQALAGAMARSAPEVPAPTPWWRREWGFRVLVPLTAGVAAIALWVAVPTRAPEEPPTAQVQPQAAPESVGPKSEVAGALQSKGLDAALERDMRAEFDRKAVEERSSLGRRDENRSALDKSDTRQNRNRDENREQAGGAPPPPSAPLRSAPLASEPPPAFAPVPAAPPPAAGPASQAAAPQAAVEEKARAARAAPGVSPAAAADSAAAPTFRSLGKVGVTQEIESPDSAMRWRLGRDGFVEYSTDRGSSWESIATGVATELTAGSSPSAPICWIVGRGGTVLLTTDGRRWQRVPFPEAVDLTAVQAVDAQAAVVTTTDGRTFRTTDAGRTWSRLSP